MFVRLERAVEVVLSLAHDNVIGEIEAANNDLSEYRKDQIACVDTVEDFFTNYWIREDE